MGVTKSKKTIDCETRVSVVAAVFVSETYAALLRAAIEPGVLAGTESSGALASTTTLVREALRLFAPLYPLTDRRRWAQRARGLSRDLKPVRESDIVAEELRSAARSAGAGGQRAPTRQGEGAYRSRRSGGCEANHRW